MIISEITIEFQETPADMDTKVISIGFPQELGEINNDSLRSFLNNCLKVEVFSIIDFRVTEVRSV